MFIDVRRVHWCAKALCVELPPEEQNDNDEIGILEESMYGTINAAQNWEEEYSAWFISV